MAKHIFVTGGVVSGLGKGMTAASLGRLLKARGLKVTNQKLDPYLNADPGKIDPLEHGEVFVLDDGSEADLDLGHYERFIDENMTTYNTTTSGKVYANLLKNEADYKYHGKTIQVIPHITDETKRLVYECAKKTNCDVLITEIGGTVGDIESLAFIEAARQINMEKGSNNCIFIHVVLVPYIKASDEHKSKPAQHSVQRLQGLGISPNIVIARADEPIDSEVLGKISKFCNVQRECVIENTTVPYLYELPLYLHDRGLDNAVCKELKLKTSEPDLDEWRAIVDKIKNRNKQVEIAIVGKYVDLHDSYLSVMEASYHASTMHGATIKWRWVNTIGLTKENIADKLSGVAGIISPAAWGKEGADGAMLAAEFARLQDIPYFGIGFGMQAAIVEYAKNVCGIQNAASQEWAIKGQINVLQKVHHEKNNLTKVDMQSDNTIRIGAYFVRLVPNTALYQVYASNNTVKTDFSVSERHCVGYELASSYIAQLEDNGLVISAKSVIGNFVEGIELPKNKFFIGVCYQPEFKSRPNRPHPLFLKFFEKAINQ